MTCTLCGGPRVLRSAIADENERALANIAADGGQDLCVACLRINAEALLAVLKGDAFSCILRPATASQLPLQGDGQKCP